MSKKSDNKKPKVLIVDDEQSILNALFRSLRDEFDVLLSLSGASALQIMREQEIAVILTDQRMAGIDGIELLRKAMDIQSDSVRVLITGYTDIETVIEAINDGQIFYYIQKPWEPDEIKAIMKRAAERYQLIQDNKRLVIELDSANQILGKENIDLKKEVEKQYSFKKIIGNSTGLAKVLDLVKKIIPTNTTVLISGETGTGKELIARAIHFNGPRKNKVF